MIKVPANVAQTCREQLAFIAAELEADERLYDVLYESFKDLLDEAIDAESGLLDKALFQCALIGLVTAAQHSLDAN